MLEKNKIYCGDCLELMKQIPDKSVDLIVTDPPYNTKMKVSKTTWLSNMFNDTYTDEAYGGLITESLTEMYRVLKENSLIYIYMNRKGAEIL